MTSRAVLAEALRPSGPSEEEGSARTPEPGPENISGEFLPEAPNPCNTGASIRHGYRETGGIDTLEVSLYGSWDEPSWPKLCQKLDKARQQAEEITDGGVTLQTREGDVYRVLPQGERHGVYCRWVIEFEGWRIAIVNRQQESEQTISAYVGVGSTALMREGPCWLWMRLQGLLKALGFNLTRDVPSRVDLCADMPGVSIKLFSRPFWAGNVIKRAINYGVFGKGTPGPDTSTGFRSGEGIQIRVYDKLTECQDDPVKLAILQERRWNGMPESATRVEFQLRRDALRDEWQVDSVRDLFDKLGSITEWLTVKWFRLVDGFDRKNRNHERAETLPVWKWVQEAFAEWTCTAAVEKPKRKMPVPDFDQLKKQLSGVAATMAAGVNASYECVGDVQAYLYNLATEIAPDMWERFKHKKLDMSFKGRIPAAGIAVSTTGPERCSVFDDWNNSGAKAG